MGHILKGLPDGSDVKDPLVMQEIPGSGRSSEEGNG